MGGGIWANDTFFEILFLLDFINDTKIELKDPVHVKCFSVVMFKVFSYIIFIRTDNL
jgi:hypothetical protein